MLNCVRRTAPAVAWLLCASLLATWITGAHGHRHVGGQQHQDEQAGGSAARSEHEHSHEAAHGRAATIASFDGEHLAPHPVALIHTDGHENIEVQALQPSAGKSMSDLIVLALFYCAVFVLTRIQALVVFTGTDPPPPRRAGKSLRPPLRGPPLFSVA